MTIKAELNQVLALVTANTQTLATLTTAISALPSGGTVDLSGIQASLDKQNAALADIQSQLETDDSVPAPSPAPSPAPAA